ncbi:hypothetical protein [Actinacidiphila acidipaludis]|nr:hypothetical protein [Streptomyces acidipaludis]
MGRHGRSAVKQFALAAAAATLLWFGSGWLAHVAIRGLLGGW